MEPKKSGIDKEYVGSIALLPAYFLIIFGCTFLAVYLAAPLFGGLFSLRAVGVYASWALLGFVFRVYALRFRKGLRVRGRDYILLGLTIIINAFMELTFPFGLGVSILMVASLAIAYRAQERRSKTTLDQS